MAWYTFVDRASTARPASASTNAIKHLVLDRIEGSTGIAYQHPVALWVGRGFPLVGFGNLALEGIIFLKN
jgi:hypothetical protein